MTDPSSTTPSPSWQLFRVIDEPGAVFHSLAQRPRSLLPIVALVIVAFVTGFLLPAEQLREQSRRQAEFIQQRAQGVPPEQAEQLQQRAEEMVANAATTKARFTLAIFGAIVPIIALVVTALILMLIFGATGAEPLGFKTEFAVTAHAYVPQLLGTLVVVGVGMAGIQDVQLSLGFLSDLESSPFLFTFLSQFGIFGVWNVVLLAVGNQILTGGKRLTGPLAIVGGLWILKNLVVAAVVGLTAGAMGGA